MMMDESRLICPKSKKTLCRITGESLNNVNELIRKKRVYDVSEGLVEGPLTALWLVDGGELFYPERNRIPVILTKKGVDINSLSDRSLVSRLLKEAHNGTRL